MAAIQKQFSEDPLTSPVYRMATADITEGKLNFPSEADCSEAMRVGFFRIKTPTDLDLEVGRTFAKTFTSNPRYNQFGVLNVANGYLQSEVAQTVRFTLDKDNWNKCHVDQREVAGPPNYSPELQELGQKLNQIAMTVLKSILERHIPEDLWFEATAGAARDEGSCFLLFNCYDPKLGSRAEGVGAHKDWSYVTVLDATEPGLEAKIDGTWRSLNAEDGYLIINVGYALEKLRIGPPASEHRVVTQKDKMRTSTVLFLDPRVGPYRAGVESRQKEGHVYDWDAARKQLVDAEPTTTFFARLSAQLYGKDQSGKK